MPSWHEDLQWEVETNEETLEHSDHWSILCKIHTYSSCSALSSLFTFVISSFGLTSNASKILNRYSITRKAKYVEASKSQSEQVVFLKGKKRPLANTVL